MIVFTFFYSLFFFFKDRALVPTHFGLKQYVYLAPLVTHIEWVLLFRFFKARICKKRKKKSSKSQMRQHLLSHLMTHWGSWPPGWLLLLKERRCEGFHYFHYFHYTWDCSSIVVFTCVLSTVMKNRDCSGQKICIGRAFAACVFLRGLLSLFFNHSSCSLNMVSLYNVVIFLSRCNAQILLSTQSA